MILRSSLLACAGLCAAGCSPGDAPPRMLSGDWIDYGVDFSISMTLAGTPGDIHGEGIYQSVGGPLSFTVSGSQDRLTWTWKDGSTEQLSVWFLDADSAFLEIAWGVPASGTCSTVVFHYDQCTADCPPWTKDPSCGCTQACCTNCSPGGFCFRRSPP